LKWLSQGNCHTQTKEETKLIKFDVKGGYYTRYPWNPENHQGYFKNIFQEIGERRNQIGVDGVAQALTAPVWQAWGPDNKNK
jgi:FMN-dependent NADH-azoreductase